MTQRLPAPTSKLPGVITMSEFSQVVFGSVHPEEIHVVMDLGAMDGGDTLELRHLFPNARAVAVEGSAPKASTS